MILYVLHLIAHFALVVVGCLLWGAAFESWVVYDARRQAVIEIVGGVLLVLLAVVTAFAG